jgi:hypothetical protein
MMEAKSIVPTGWHFVAHFCEPDGMTRISPLDRRNHIVRYYFIGFGNCYHIAPKTARLVRDIGGNDTDVPELLTGQPYDPFKHDIYTLGNVFDKELYQVRCTYSRFIMNLVNLFLEIPWNSFLEGPHRVHAKERIRNPSTG